MIMVLNIYNLTLSLFTILQFIPHISILQYNAYFNFLLSINLLYYQCTLFHLTEKSIMQILDLVPHSVVIPWMFQNHAITLKFSKYITIPFLQVSRHFTIITVSFNFSQHIKPFLITY